MLGLLTRLLHAEVDGKRLSGEEMFDFFVLLRLAGSETIPNLIGNAALRLLAHPERFARLRARPGLIPGAIEEVLRYRSPVQVVFRSTTRDVALGRRVIPAGRLVLAMVGSASRDPARFGDAERSALARPADPHLASGHGAHFCIGAALARLEGRVALDVLGPSRLPLRFERA